MSGSEASREAERSRAANLIKSFEVAFGGQIHQVEDGGLQLGERLATAVTGDNYFAFQSVTQNSLKGPLGRPPGFPDCPLGKRVDWGGVAYPVFSFISLCYFVFAEIGVGYLS